MEVAVTLHDCWIALLAAGKFAGIIVLGLVLVLIYGALAADWSDRH